jgi:hypothetical protein
MEENTRGSQKISFFYVNSGSGCKKILRISLDNSPLFLHVVSKYFQAPVVIYDGIFQTLEPEGDVLHKKPFLDRTPPHLLYSSDSAFLDFQVFGKVKKYLRGQRFPSDITVKAQKPKI